MREREIEQNAKYDIAYSWFFFCLFVFATNWHGVNFPVIPIHNDMIFEFKGSIFALFSSFLLWKVLQWHSGFKQFTINSYMFWRLHKLQHLLRHIHVVYNIT